MLARKSPAAGHARGAGRHALTIDDVGDPHGTPVVYLHGGGDSRLSRHPDDSIAAELVVRLLAVDRCGPALRHGTLRGWAEATLAALPVERFAVIGWSAGGPHALALAAVAPERVSRVALVGAMPPVDLVSHLSSDVRAVMRVARVSPSVAARGLERWGRKPTPPTGDALTDDAYARGRIESFRSGGLWLARELAYLGRPWGFELADVQVPVTLWWGERDRVCPPPIAYAYLERLPRAELRLLDDNHQLLFGRWREILTDVVSA
ncbi:MAG TPA: alpha/beta fold hydrolase [Gaiellaceae bacterium]|nr:alpha/beta fold hydrolase [Gaiellaceae bacterium]